MKWTRNDMKEMNKKLKEWKEEETVWKKCIRKWRNINKDETV